MATISRRSAVPVATVATTAPRRRQQRRNGLLASTLLSLPLLAIASPFSSPSSSYGGAAAAAVSAAAFLPIPPIIPAVLRRRSAVRSTPTADSSTAWTLRSVYRHYNTFEPARVSMTVSRCHNSVDTARVSTAEYRYCNSFGPARVSTAFNTLTATSVTNGDVSGDGGGSSATALPGVGGSAGGSSTNSHGLQIVSTPETTRSDNAVSDPAAKTKGGDVVVVVAPAPEAKRESGTPKGTRRVAGGSPKWVHTVRRRMLTKNDWLHVHAASSLLFQVCGALWLLNVLGTELFAGTPQLETNTPFPLFILGTGLVSVLSSIPMANTRSWVLNGIFTSFIQLWYAWYVSGGYPASLAPADPWLAAASFAILIINYVEVEESIATENRKRSRELELSTSEGAGRPPKAASGHIEMRKGDYGWGDAINRAGAIANLAPALPHLYATFTGSGWVERLGEAYPGGPVLLFHAYFATATSGSITLLAATLYTRRLVDARTFGLIQLLLFAPLVTSYIDVATMGSATTGNPLEIYLGFLH